MCYLFILFSGYAGLVRVEFVLYPGTTPGSVPFKAPSTPASAYRPSAPADHDSFEDSFESHTDMDTADEKYSSQTSLYRWVGCFEFLEIMVVK